jgi:hypothetical protein
MRERQIDVLMRRVSPSGRAVPKMGAKTPGQCLQASTYGRNGGKMRFEKRCD